MSRIVDAQQVAYAAEVAAALQPLVTRDVGYGMFNIGRVTIEFEGEATEVAVVMGEHGDLAVEVAE